MDLSESPSHSGMSCEEPGCSTRDPRNDRLGEWIALAAAGDLSAFESLYEETAPWLLRRVRRIVGDCFAEDVLTEVYLQVWRSLRDYAKHRGEPLAWLSMIGRSRAIDRLRIERTCHAGQSGPPCTEGMVEPSHDDTPERQASRQQDAALLQSQLLHLLTKRERMVLDLAFVRECSHTEIAAVTGMPVGTVKSLISRSREKLRRNLVAR